MRQGCPQVAHSGVPQGSREDYSEAARLPPHKKIISKRAILALLLLYSYYVKITLSPENKGLPMVVTLHSKK
jgi:hypothetical protein